MLAMLLSNQHNRKVTLRYWFLALVAVLAFSQQSSTDDEWRRPVAPFRIAGNVYYVGTYDLACYLITTPSGHILLNTGLADSTPLIRRSITELGFKLSDVKILLTNQAHYDHVAALAEIQKETGARMFAAEGDVQLLEDGGSSDFHFGDRFKFALVTVHRKLKQGDRVELGGTQLTVHLMPGHTRGSVGYAMRVPEGNRSLMILFANMASINPGVRLLGNTRYPGIAEDYARTFRTQKELKPDIFLAGHASQFGMHEKLKRPASDGPARFIDPDGYRRRVEEYEAAYRKQLAEEQAGRTR